MKFAATLTVLSAFAASAVAQTIQIAQPPNFVTCQPGRISWTGGQAPFFLSILPGSNTAAAPLVNLGEQDTNVFVWNANVEPGQEITVRVSDSQGIVQYSSQIPVIAGSNTDCIGQPIDGTMAGSTVAATSTGSQSSIITNAEATETATETATVSAGTTGAAGGVVGGASSVVSSVVTSVSSVISSVTASVTQSVTQSVTATTSVVSTATTGTTATTAVTSSVAGGAQTSAPAGNAAAAQSIGGVGAVIIGAIGAVVALF